MHVRLDEINAKAIRKSALAYRRLFKRRKSYSTFVNEALRDLFGKRPTVNTP